MTNNAGDGPWHPAIHAKLTSIAEELSERPAWYEQWQQLNAKSSDEERLSVYQAIRDANVLPDDAGFYLVTWHIDAMSSKAAQDELREMDEQMSAIEHEHGLGEGEICTPEEAPPEYELLRLAYQEAWNDIFVRLLRHFGEHDAAQLFEQDHDEYERRSEVGRAYFHGPMLDENAPEWLCVFVEMVVGQMTADSPMGPLHFQYGQDEECWDVVIVELVGGAQDGEIVVPGFALDLEGLRAAFDAVHAMGWKSLGLPDDGPHVFAEGIVAGNELLLRVMAYPPEDEEPGIKLET